MSKPWNPPPLSRHNQRLKKLLESDHHHARNLRSLQRRRYVGKISATHCRNLWHWLRRTALRVKPGNDQRYE